MKPAAATAILLAALALVGCGSSGHRTAAASAASPKPNPRLQRDLARINADLAHLRAVTAPVTRPSLMGTPAIRKATDRFLEHLETSSIPLLERNRLIDHAAASVSGVCGQCFQILEAARPIPELAHPNA